MHSSFVSQEFSPLLTIHYSVFVSQPNGQTVIRSFCVRGIEGWSAAVDIFHAQGHKKIFLSG